MLDPLHVARIFTILDLCGTYNLIPNEASEEYMTAFLTHYGQFKYWVMPFSQTTAPATFQSYIDDFPRPYIDNLAVCCLNNILIYLTNETEHKVHMQQVLLRLM